MRLASVFGTRPQLVKVAAMLDALGPHLLVDTGQHHDRRLAFFDDLELPRPDYSLGISGGSHGEQTGRMLAAVEAVLRDERPDAVLVYGDTNSTLAGALAAAKLNIPVAHVEAGLRTFDRTMPEEVNRVVADHLSTWCFAPYEESATNLAAEGLRPILVGDVMQDMAAANAAAVMDPDRLPDGLVPDGYIFATVHRAANRTAGAVQAWTAILAAAARRRPVVLALHPGTAAAIGSWTPPPGVRVVEPVPYRASLALQANAYAVITDSGSMEREAAWFGTPCIVIRDSSETHFGTLVGLALAPAVEALDRIVPSARRSPVASGAAAAIAEVLA